jgi:hypothetical protein
MNKISGEREEKKPAPFKDGSIFYSHHKTSEFGQI